MSDSLYNYYERELIFIRQLAQEFAKQYPAAAGRLLLEPNRSIDPHVERLIESFALLAGRIHHKLDDEFPELTDALLGVLYPHYLAPVPSMAIIEFKLDPARAQLPNGFLIDRGSRLHTQAVGSPPLPCKFRTGYPVTLWPVELTAARVQGPPFPAEVEPPQGTQAILRLRLDCQANMQFAALSLDKLRFYLAGDNQVIASLYELIFNHAVRVEYRPVEKNSKLPVIRLTPEECLQPFGFERSEGLLPYPNQSFLGYRLLTEYFAFPYKFLFLDLGGWRQVAKAGYQKQIEVIVYLNRTIASVEQGIDVQAFRLGCTPIINLMEQIAEPIPLSQARHEYRILPDVTHPQGMEVYSVDSVTSVDPTTGITTEYQPFYSFRHGRTRDSQRAFWYASRRPSLAEGDRGTDVYLNLVDLDFDPRLPATATLVIRTTCTNRELPGLLMQAGDRLHLELEAAAPLARIRILRSPSLPIRPPLRRGAHWRLISHLSLNHLSITDPVEGRAALQEILRLYDFTDPEIASQQASINRQLIDGITSVSSRRVVGRTGGPTASGFAKGVEVTVEFDEQKYVGTGVFLFACVLERFLGLYASINSFSQLVARLKQGEGYLKKWPPRAAEHRLL